MILKIRSFRLLLMIIGLLSTSELVFSNHQVVAPDQEKQLGMPAIPVPYQVYSHLKKTQIMSLREAILLSLRYNITVRNSELERITQKYQVAIARNAFEPQYSLGGTANYSPNTKASFDLTPTVKLTNTYGTTINANVKNETLPGNQMISTGGVTISQPLLRGAGRDIVLTNLRNTMDGDQQNRLSLKAQLMQTVTEVINNYYATVRTYNLLEVDRQSLERSEKNLQEVRLRVDVGKRPLADLTRQEGDIAGQRLLYETSQKRAQDALQDLLKLIGLDPDAKLDVNKNINLKVLPVPDLNESIEIALKNNTNYLGTLVQLRVAQRSLMQAKDKKRWKLDLEAQGSAQLWRRPYQNTTNTRNTSSVRLSLDIPIDNLAIDQEIASAKIALQKQKFTIRDTKQMLIKNIINAVRNIEVARKQIDIAELNYEFKYKVYENSLLSWKYGKTTYFQVVQDQAEWRRAGVELINQKIDYLALLAALDNLMGITLERWGIKVEY